MIAIITFSSRAVNHSIRGLAGTREELGRPVATQRLRRVQLIRRLPSGILLPPCPIHPLSQPGHLNFQILYIARSYFQVRIFMIWMKTRKSLFRFNNVTIRHLHYFCIILDNNIFLLTPLWREILAVSKLLEIFFVENYLLDYYWGKKTITTLHSSENF